MYLLQCGFCVTCQKTRMSFAIGLAASVLQIAICILGNFPCSSLLSLGLTVIHGIF